MSDHRTQEILKNRKLWIEALRSGKYNKGIGALRVFWDSHYSSEVSFCAFGVGFDSVGIDLSNNFCYGTAIELFGLIGENLGDIVSKNDYQHRTFKEIADYIESLPVHIPKD